MGHLSFSCFDTIWSAVASVGWYITAIIISLWYASPYIQEKYTNWKREKDEQEYAAKYHKDPDLSQERLSAVDASRQKMQQEYYQKCVEAQKTKEKIKEASGVDKASLNHRLESKDNDDQSSFTDNKHKSLKKEYNPLMGDSSRGYRPPKRSCCKKGGCG